jgi:NAD(P)-dependent dehydrogenase (short-subunit alcohol dehydrogenase family)
MNIKDKVVIVTGGGNGIGKAMCQRFAAEGAKAVVVADLEGASAEAVAAEIGGLGVEVDVTDEAAIQNLVDTAVEKFGAVDIFCSNAGVLFMDTDPHSAASLDNAGWQKIWEINVMSHVYAARAAIPVMRKQGGGYLLNTVSAAGLLNQIGSAAYSTTKHAAMGFAESLAITHGDEGIKVSALCPQAVATRMMTDNSEAGGSAGVDGVRSAEEVADAVVKGIAEEQFLILSHPEVDGYFKHKANDYGRWVGGMRKLRRMFLPELEK